MRHPGGVPRNERERARCIYIDRWVGYKLCRGGEGNKSSRIRTKRHFPITARVPAPVAGVADGQLGTKRRIDVDNLARASFERQIPCRKISDFPRKRGVPSREKDRRGREKKGKERERERERRRQAVEQFHGFVSVRDRRMYTRK